MKTKLLITALLVLVSLNPFKAQMVGEGASNSGYSACAINSMSTLSGCLTENGVVFKLIMGGSSVYLQTTSAPNNGAVQSCVAQYNNDKSSCASLPTLVLTSTRVSKK